MNLLALPFGVPYLSSLWIIMLVGALVCVVLPRSASAALRLVATATSALALILSALLLLAYNPAGLTFQFVERLPWIASFGVFYFVGADGLNLPMLVLTALVLFGGVLMSWHIDERPKEYWVLVHALGMGLFVAFMALDLLLLYAGTAFAVAAAFLLRGGWGDRTSPTLASTIYLLGGLGSVFVGLLAVYFAGGRTFNLIELAQNNDWGVLFQTLWFVPLFLGFAVLAGMVPFHTSVLAGVTGTPTVGAMLHAGAIVSLGAYGCVRVALWLLPAGAVVWSPVLIALALLTLLYGAVLAFMAHDLRGVFGYATVSRIGLVLLGIAVLNAAGLDGAVLLLFGQGLTAALFFAVVGRMIVARTGTAILADLGEFGRIMPFSGAVAIIGAFALVGFPGFATFLGTSTTIQGAWARYPAAAIVALVGILATVAYVLRVLRFAFFGAARNTPIAQLPRLTWQEYVVGALFVVVIVAVGVFPSALRPLTTAGVGPVLQRLADADALVRSAGNPFFGR